MRLFTLLTETIDDMTTKERVTEALNISWKGMLSIIVAMLIICVVIYVLNALTKTPENELEKKKKNIFIFSLCLVLSIGVLACILLFVI